MRKRNLKRLLALLLCACMIIGLMPAASLAVTTEDTMSATVYTGQESGTGAFTDKTDTFAVDQSGLILHLENFRQAVPDGWSLESLAFYPTDGSSQWGTVFWFSGSEDYPCDNGTPNDKLDNGVFQLLNFTPDGNMPLEPGSYQVLAYAGNGKSGDQYQEKLYLSDETFTITGAEGPGDPVITTGILPDAYVNEAYNQTLTANPAEGGTLSWALASGSSLPEGLALNAAGVISGTPSAAGSTTFSVTVTETDGSGQTTGTAAKEFAVTVRNKLEIATQTLPNATRGTYYDQTLSSNFANAVWSIKDGNLPPGLSLSGNGRIYGTCAQNADGNYTFTVKAEADSQSVEKEFSITTDNTFVFTTTGTDSDAIGRYCCLSAKQNGSSITLWSGKYSEDLKISVPARYAGAAVTDVQLTTFLYPSGDMILAEKSDETSLINGGSAALEATEDPIITLPEIRHDYGDNVRVSYKNENGYSLSAGDLVSGSGTYTLYAYAYLYDQAFVLSYDTDKKPEFTVGNERKDIYTRADLGKPVSMKYPSREKTTVTFTLLPGDGFEGDVPDLSGASLSFNQNVKYKNYTVTEQIEKDNTVTAELYTGVDASVTLHDSDLYSLATRSIEEIDGSSIELKYKKNSVTGASVRAVVRLADGVSEDFREYAALISQSNITPSITCSENTWQGRGSSSVMSALQSSYRTFRMYNYGCDDFLEPLIQNGGTYSLAWKDDGAVLAGKTGDLTWAKNNLYTDAEITLDLKGGLLLEIDYSNSKSYQSMYGWWYTQDDGSWIRDSKITTVNPRKDNYAFFCPGDEGSYNFLLLPSQAISPADMTWDEAVAASSGMPYVEDITVKNNTAEKASVKLEGSFIASAIYATVPNSTLVGPAQFSDVNESMTFTGHIELDEGVQGNMKVLRINAAGTDSGGRVATQITSVVVDGKKYPYTKIELQNQTLSGQLVSKQFQTYYQITFEDPVKLPCDITIYGKSMRTSSDCVLNVTAELDNEKYDWQPVGTVTVKAPVISVEMPDSTSSGTVLAYLSIPSSQTVDIYDGDTLVLSRVRSGDVEIPLNGTAAGRVSVHTITFKWSNNNDISSAPVSQTVIHADGVPKLTEQYLQCGSSRSNSWRNVERNHIYSYTSSNPPEFRLTCTIENSENLAGGVVFSVTRLDGTVSYMGTAQSGDTFTTEAFSGSPVIGAAALYEPDWDKINAVLQAEMPSLPDDSPSRDRTGFAETVVIPYEDHKIQFEEQPSLTDEETEELTGQIQAFQAEIEKIYRNNGGQAGFYLIDIGTQQFVPAADMINSLDTGYVPQGETGTTTMARPLTPGQLDGELGSGEWSRYTFTEPGASGGSASTGMEIYTQSVTTESGVSGTITIATDGQGNIFEFATAQGEGTGSGEGYTLPESGTYPSGGTGSGGVGGFSFTSFGSDGMSVFTNVCDDVTFTSNTIKDITSAFTGAEATGAFGMIDRGLGIYSFGKDMADGMDKQLTLANLLNAPNGWLSSPCAQKLSPAYRQNMQRQIDQFIKDVRDAEAWNMVVTGGNYILGAGGLFGLVNPVAGIIGGTAAWGASKITSQKVDNVQKQAVLLRDMIDLQIEKTARANNDPDCMGKSSKARRQPYNVCIDPSGIVYEAVLSNPVEGATVKLYGDGTDYKPVYTVNNDELPVMVDDNGNPAVPSNKDEVIGAALSVPKENATIPAEHELTTAANGKFQWMVQEGLWYVTAEKEGYEAGSSGNDRAAVVDAGGTKWLPVSPEQLDVNIPLISYDAPSAEVAYKPDGVYISFSKYMDDMTLTDGNFTLTSDGQPVSFTVEKLNSEQAPANINYDGDPPRYTSQIKLASPLDENAKISLTIGENVKTYAGIAWGETSALQGTVTNAADLEKPEFSQNGGTVDYGTVITITGPEGAQIYYTTDGSEPSADNGTRYYGENILMNADMTIKACAIKLGTSSDVATATFRVSPADDGSIIGDPDNQPGTEPGGNTPGGSGGGSGGEISHSVSVPASSGIQGGSITVSPRSADQGDIVTITVRPDENYELDTLTVTDAKGNKVELTRAGDNRYTFTMPGSDVKIAVSFKESAEQVTNPFTDVHESDYYCDAVLWAVANGVTNGTGGATFSPDNPVSRAQMVTFLWRAHGSPKATGSNPFTDVDESAWYYDAVLWAVANGVTNGTSATTFSPDTSVTRAQSVTFQWRAAGSPEASGSSFDDVAENAYYNDAVVWAVASGITVGTGGNNFSPDVVVSRAQAVTFLYRELA